MRICYINLTKNMPTRDVVYLAGLRENGVDIIDIRDHSPGLKKFFVIFREHKKIIGNYDVLWVGYSGHILVPFTKLISRKKIIFNSLGSLYESKVDSHNYPPFSWTAMRSWVIDYLAFHAANLSLIDTVEEIEYLKNKFWLNPNKLLQTWTGVNDKDFFYDPSIKKLQKYTVVFRGAFVPECGIEIILDAAKLLKNKPVKFRIIGRGFLESLVEQKLNEFDSKNVEWIKEWLPIDKLRIKMQECHISLGVATNKGRLERTIYHKVFESLAMKLPYLTAENKAIKELLTDSQTCIFFKPNDASDLAEKIIWLQNNPLLCSEIAENGYDLYSQQLKPQILARKVMQNLKL